MAARFKTSSSGKIIVCFLSALLILHLVLPVMAQADSVAQLSAISQLAEQEKAAFIPDSEDLQEARESGKTLTLPQAIRDSIEMTRSGYVDIGQGFAEVAEGFRTAPGEIANALDTLTEGQGVGRLFRILGAVLFIYGIGLALEWVVRRVSFKFRYKIEARHTGNLFQRLLNDLVLTGFELAYFAVFFYTTINVMILFSGQSGVTLVAEGFLVPITRARIGILILRFLFSSRSMASRIIPISCYAAQQITYWVSLTLILSPLVAETLFILSALGMGAETTTALFMLEIILPTILLLIPVWRNRTGVKNYILATSANSEPGTFSFWLANNWHRAAIAYLLFLVSLRQLSLLQGREMFGALFLSLISVPGAILLDMTLLAALKSIIQKKNRLKKIEPDAPGSCGHICHIHSGLQAFLGVGLALYLLEVWGVSLNLGPALSKGAMSIFFTVLVSYLIWEYLSGVIDSQFEGLEEGDEMEEMGKGGSRKNTLLILLKKFITISIIVISTLIVLTSMGVNIGPLIAGAGIFGLAVGFGAQTLVKDVLSGVFFLIDDAFRIGDYVESGSLKGTVERISVRSISLRHSRGQYQIIPYGSLGSVTNFSRDWTAMKLELRIPFDVDPEKVRKIIKKMGKKIVADEELGPLLLTPVKSMGVKEIDDSSQVIRIKFRCRPGDQFALRKEVFRRVREDFAANGIEFAPKKVMVHVPNIENAVLTKEQVASIAAAAAETRLSVEGEKG